MKLMEKRLMEGDVLLMLREVELLLDGVHVVLVFFFFDFYFLFFEKKNFPLWIFKVEEKEELVLEVKMPTKNIQEEKILMDLMIYQGDVIGDLFFFFHNSFKF